MRETVPDRRWLACCARGAAAAALLGALLGCTADPTEVVTAAADEPRAFGWYLGDVVARRIRIDAPPGAVLDAASLPRLGVRGGAFELRGIDWVHGGPHTTATRHELILRYQLMRSPPELRIYELPAVVLRFKGATRAQEARLDAWGLVTSPLVPIDAPTRRGLGALRPDAAAVPIDTRPARLRLIGYGAAALLLLGYLTHVYLGVPWRRRRQRPFAAAWRALRTLPAGSADAQRTAAYARLHSAFNASSGEALFETGIDRFLAQHPRFAPLRDEIVQFFQASKRVHFGSAAPGDGGQDGLLAFCRRCRDVERGSA